MSRRPLLSDTTWARHANPWSGWTRLASYPLAFLPIATRSWRLGLIVAAWFALNPLLWRPPTHDRSWMTRGVLGERLWTRGQGDPSLSRRMKGWSVVTAALFIPAVVQTWRHRWAAAIPLSLGAFGTKIWFVHLAGRLYEREKRAGRARML